MNVVKLGENTASNTLTANVWWEPFTRASNVNGIIVRTFGWWKNGNAASTSTAIEAFDGVNSTPIAGGIATAGHRELPILLPPGWNLRIQSEDAPKAGVSWDHLP